MIIGNGDIAQALYKAKRPQDDGYVFFASGVSNSAEMRESEYDREKKLLLDQDPLKHIVYFSSLSIFYASTRYTLHKRQMEKLAKKCFVKSTIIRIGNITWGDNPHTIINTLRRKYKEEESFDILNVIRYIVTEKEFLHWIDMIPDWDCEINIPGQMMTVKEIVNEYVYE